MAAGENVSVSSQADSERADAARERRELQDDPASELEELAGVYVKRGLDPELVYRVAKQLMERDALGQFIVRERSLRIAKLGAHLLGPGLDRLTDRLGENGYAVTVDLFARAVCKTMPIGDFSAQKTGAR
jgi:hypothetical protein